jgi:hypothetical protein
MQHSMKEDLLNIIAPLMVRPITRWPFFAFLGGAMFCLLASSTCHLLNCHSERVSYIMLRLDYAGIAALISTSFFPPVYYSFMCNPFFCNLYLGFITLLGIATVLVSLLPIFQTPKFRVIRASLFFGMGFSGIAPTWGSPHNWIWVTDGSFLRAWSFGLCHKDSWTMDAGEIRPCRAQPPTISCISSCWSVHSLSCRVGLSQVAWSSRLLVVNHDKI